jgi:hypothetical protein
VGRNKLNATGRGFWEVVVVWSYQYCGMEGRLVTAQLMGHWRDKQDIQFNGGDLPTVRVTVNCDI